MSSAIVTMSLTLAVHAFGLGHATRCTIMIRTRQLYIVPPARATVGGFLNGNPDGYGWVDYGVYLPLGADRTAEYYFPRYFAIPPAQMFPADLLQLLRDPGPTVHSVRGRRRGSPDGRATAGFVSLARFSLHGQPRRRSPWHPSRV